MPEQWPISEPVFSEPRPSRSVNPRAHEAPNYDLELKQLEEEFLFRRLERPYLRQRAAQIGEIFPGQSMKMVEALDGALHHEDAEGLFRVSLLRFGERVNKSVVDVTREDVAEAHRSNPMRERMEEEERAALEKYDDATDGYWKVRFLDTNDIRALRADLDARRIERIEDPTERKHQFEMLDREYTQIIERTSDPGKKFEAQLTYLLRRWTREAGADHVVECRHGLPREDMAEATDLVCTIGADQYNVQIKAVTSDSNREEKHTQEVFERAVRREAKTGTPVIVIDPRDLIEAYAFTTAPESDLNQSKRVRRTKARQRIIRLLAGATTPNLEKLLIPQKEAAVTPTSEKTGKKLTAKFLEANSSVPHLVRIGLLSQSEAVDPQKIVAAKQDMKERLPDLQVIFPTQESWTSPSSDAVAQVRELFRGEHIPVAAE